MTTRRQREHLKTQLIETDRLLGMVSGHPFMSASLSARRKEVEERLQSLPVGEVEPRTVLFFAGDPVQGSIGGFQKRPGPNDVPTLGSERTH